MHYPHPKNEYEAGLRRVAEGIEMARRGAYRDGYLKMILEALECLEQMAHQVGMYQRDGGMIANLKREFQSELQRQDAPAGESPLAALVADSSQEAENQYQEEQHQPRNPLNRR